MNEAVLITTSQQALDTFGDPFPESYLMYAVLAYQEEGNQCYVMRVGIEYEEGLDADLLDIAIDVSGSRAHGWGRIPVFTGIDYGRITLREVSTDAPVVIHASSVDNISYNDAVLSTTDGATTATLETLGTYTDAIDDSFVMVITGAPSTSDAASISGATFQVIRNSDGEVVAEGTLSDSGELGVSNWISLGNGLSIRISVTVGDLDVNDTFVFDVHPDNRVFKFAVENDTPTEYTMTAATYTTAATFIAAVNALVSGDDYLATTTTLTDGTVVPQIRTRTAGEWIQMTGSEAWALELGIQLYEWDIPRAYLLATHYGPYVFTSQNNRVSINIIGTETANVQFSMPVASSLSTVSTASVIDAAGTVGTESYFESLSITLPTGKEHVVILTTTTHKTDTLQLLANYSNIKTLRFAEELDILSPYQSAYRGFNDIRTSLPDAGTSSASTPLSCETDPAGADCAVDSSYYDNIVGWFVAPTAGTWIDSNTLSLSLFTTGVGEVAGRYTVTIRDSNGAVVESINDVSFDQNSTRFISDVLNPGTTYGGRNGNTFVNWEDRPAFLDNDPTLASYVPRQPSQFANREFAGSANGIPTNAAFSSNLDAAVIGNPALSTGIYAFQNPETIDINLLAIPGFSSGQVIGTALQMCESRGDVLYIVDPPFGLRPQQVVDWHNGILLSDLNAAINSSYGALYWSWVKIYDQFSQQELWIPPSGHVTAVYSRTSRVAEQWYAPAGIRRGRLLTARDVEYAPSQGERDLLYGSGNAVNAITKFPQDGIVVFGQRTLLRSESVFDRANVRMLFSGLKKTMQRSLRNFIMEPNDKVLWRQVVATLDPYLSDVQNRRGITAYKLICDESNNTPERQARKELWVTVLVQPTTAAEFIILNLVGLRDSASFSANEVLVAGGVVVNGSL
jgi:hypothetical protein